MRGRIAWPGCVRAWTTLLLFVVLAALVVPAPKAAVAAEPSYSWNLRVAWGGGTARQWRGSISLTEGTLGLLGPLGIEADVPGSAWCEHGQLMFEQPSARSYDGLDLTALAPRSAKLVLALQTPGEQSPKIIEVPLRQLVDQYHSSDIDDQGNRLLVQRTPGDSLRVELPRSSLIFEPGEKFHGQLHPHMLPVTGGTRVRFRMELRAADSDEIRWSNQVDRTITVGGLDNPPPAATAPAAAAGADGATAGTVPTSHQTSTSSTPAPAATSGSGIDEPIVIDFAMPGHEGVYNLYIEATVLGLRSRLGLKQVAARRTVQVLVLSTHAPAPSEEPFRVVHEFDPANPSWLKRISDWPLPGFRSGPLSSGTAQLVDHPLGRAVELNASTGGNTAWQAYPLPIAAVGQPHILEVEFPSDLPQTLGISVIEAGPGRTTPAVTLDSGFDLPQPSAGPQRWLKHRLVFWPSTNAPWVLFHNRRGQHPAVYGKVRLLAGPMRLPEFDSPGASSEDKKETKQAAKDGRAVYAYLDKPLFAKNFLAAEAVDGWSGRALADWTTFYQGANRLSQYLKHLGYGGALVTAACEGGAIYPSDLMQPTPRFDTGVYFASGQDLQRKDGLELLLRLFDRYGLKLIPAVDFSSPLPELETILRAGGPEADGLVWVGADGMNWRQRHRGSGPAPYYNPLHPRVQAAMLQVVRELARRCAKHESFDSLALSLSARGYAQLPGPEWGFDDATVARFTHDTGIEVPGAGPTRYTERAAHLLGPKRAEWLAWRAAVMKNLYRAMRRELVLAKPDSKLILAAGKMFDGPPWQSRLVPTLPQRVDAADILLEAGIDPQLHREPGIVMLRPETVQLAERLGALSPQLGWDVARAFAGPQGAAAVQASLLHHPALSAEVKSFEPQAPFAPGVGWIAAHTPPAAEFNRRRFARHLAAFDSRMLFDGGFMLPLGQEEPLSDLLAVLRSLPSESFTAVDEVPQPLTVRIAASGKRTWLYAVNDSPWQVKVRLYLDDSVEKLSRLGLHQGEVKLDATSEGRVWQLEIEPYGLVGAAIDAVGVKVRRVEVELPPDCQKPLTAKLEELAARAASLRDTPHPLPLTNRDFETPGTGELPAAWTASRQPGTLATLDNQEKYQGERSLKLSSIGPILSVVSDPLEPPQTGRFAISVWLRVDDDQRQPPLRLAIEGVLEGGQYYRHAAVGLGQRVPKIHTRWTQFVFQVHDLPTQGLSELRVRFDLMGPGEVWVDEVQCFDLLFRREELVELSKLITLAGVKLQNNEVADCLRLLEGYWPRFLTMYVPTEPPAGIIAENGKTPGDGANGDAAGPAAGTKPAADTTAAGMTPDAGATPQPAQNAADKTSSAQQAESSQSKPAERTGFMDRMKQFVPRWMRF